MRRVSHTSLPATATACLDNILRGVVAEEGRPRLARWARARPSPVLLDRPLAEPDPEIMQLALDALGAPETILSSHEPDARDRLGRDVRRPAA